MPKESGIRLYRNMKTDNKFKDIPIVILSGIAEKSFLRSQKVLTEFGDDPVPAPEAYLEKPVDADVLAGTIEKNTQIMKSCWEWTMAAGNKPRRIKKNYPIRFYSAAAEKL